MNDQLQAQVTTILKQFSDGISTVGDVAMKELPDIAQQYITYGFFKGILASIIATSCMIACIYSMFLVPKVVERTGNDEAYMLFLPAGMLTVLSATLAYTNVQNLLLNVFAPKLWLLLEIKNLIS